jgi:tRNA U34 2-thiouridine synthase MnmA/TrmU
MNFYFLNFMEIFLSFMEFEKKLIKGLVLFSGGLDSVLAVKILENLGIKVKGVYFKSYFFDEKRTKEIAKNLKIKLKVVDFSKEHLKIVKKPKYGYGKAMNPCLDCHILMLKKAKKILEKEKFDFVATGEVLGERPFSQNKKALDLVEKESSLKGYLLRPLSAKLLKITQAEKKGWLKREKLLDISGRSRKRQFYLAKKFKIKKYLTPAGGCLLTDLEFSKKLKELFKIFPKCNGNDIELLKLGRHFLENKAKIVVGRNEKENKKIKKLKKSKDILIEMENYPGPTTLIRNYQKGKISEKILEKAKELTKYYSKKARDKKDVKFKVKIQN